MSVSSIDSFKKCYYYLQAMQSGGPPASTAASSVPSSTSQTSGSVPSKPGKTHLICSLLDVYIFMAILDLYMTL